MGKTAYLADAFLFCYAHNPLDVKTLANFVRMDYIVLSAPIRPCNPFYLQWQEQKA